MNEQPRRPLGPQPWDTVRNKLDQSLPFANMRDTPYYRDCVWEQFSAGEYKRRYESLRAKMREHKLDAVVVPGGPSHWSFGAGMTWLTGHWEWHALCCYVLVPLDGEPTMIYSMGGTHAEAVRRHVEVAVKDVRHSRNGQYAMVMVERLRELKLEKGRIGLMEIDPRHGDYLPVNQYNTLRQELPDAELVFTKNFLHDLVVIHSKEELDCVRKAGVLCERAMEAMVARARPGVKEYEIKAAAAAAIMDGGGDIDFLIIGSTPMDNPARRSARRSRSGRRPTWCADSGRTSRCRATTRSWPRSRPARTPRRCRMRAASSATRACSRGRPSATASTSSPTTRMSARTTSAGWRATCCSSPA
jgi:hypothetical protein